MDFHLPPIGIGCVVRHVGPPTCLRRSTTRLPPCHAVIVNHCAPVPLRASDSRTVALTWPEPAGDSARWAASGEPEVIGIGKAMQKTATAPAAIAAARGIVRPSAREVS